MCHNHCATTNLLRQVHHVMQRHRVRKNPCRVEAKVVDLTVRAGWRWSCSFTATTERTRCDAVEVGTSFRLLKVHLSNEQEIFRKLEPGKERFLLNLFQPCEMDTRTRKNVEYRRLCEISLANLLAWFVFRAKGKQKAISCFCSASSRETPSVKQEHWLPRVQVSCPRFSSRLVILLFCPFWNSYFVVKWCWISMPYPPKTKIAKEQELKGILSPQTFSSDAFDVNRPEVEFLFPFLSNGNL